ncbi:MAG TPA: Clp protease N-terminal domain-containing protein [Ktedonobacteraceae bacterium]
MEPLKTTEEIADYLRVEVVTVRRLATRGELPAYRVGGEFRFVAQEIQDFVRNQRIGSSAVNDRFDKFTERARKVLSFANQEAVDLEHNYVGTEHLLLGIVKENEGVAALALIRAGLDLKDVRQQVLNLIEELRLHATQSPTSQAKAAINTLIRGTTRPGSPFGERPLTARAKKVIELAVDEALRLKHRYIGTEHLLLGLLLEREGAPASMLIEKCGLTLEATRELVLQILQETSTTTLPVVPEQAATLLNADQSAQTCGRCGARNPDYFRYCFHCGLKFPEQQA